ncbi:helix-turn-helix domain-containing protein, partial [Leeia sp. TBRC 13508]
MDKTTLNYLEQAKEVTGCKSDYALAKVLETTTPVISRYMSGQRIIDAEMCFKLAVILKVDPAEIVATAEYERAKTDDKREIFKSFLSSIRHAAGWLVAVSALTLALQGGGQRVGQDSQNHAKAAIILAVFYILFL